MALTPKQEAFAQAIVDGLNYTDAYRQAYDTENMAPGTVNTEGCVLANDPKITLRITELRELRQVEQAWSRALVIHKAARNADAAFDARQYAASNGALGLIAEVQGLKVHKVEHSGDINHHLMPNLSLDQLQALIAKAEAEALECWQPAQMGQYGTREIRGVEELG